jgi:predicted ATP-dependent endonuclease of OLD family
MIIFKNIEIEKFRNIKRFKLEGLKDLNFLIGPNNCGKTNFLELILNLSKISLGGSYICEECEKFRKAKEDEALYLSFTTGDFYLSSLKEKMKISFLLNEEFVNELAPNVLIKQRQKLQFDPNSNINPCKDSKDEIVMEAKEGNSTLFAVHYSPFIHRAIIEEIKNLILYCPEGRLQRYKEKEFAQYIRELRLSLAQKLRWIDFLKRVVDPQIDGERYENLIRKIDTKDFETEISKQGSGVRSLVCLGADILFSQSKKIVLIDEPELGLNPFAKQEFLRFLLEQSNEKQIFVATQDPTFVNPILWRDEKVAVYFYSIIDEGFHKIDLKQNQEDPEIFAGYMPHTVSLKNIHIYVEGSSDVYVFQIFLERYLKKFFPENWFELLNSVGVYHLCGDVWRHLLYTIPRQPYRCLIILDGDKREEVKEVCQKYNESKIISPQFDFCASVEDIAAIFGSYRHPIYCLKEDCIEKYLIPNYDCAKIPKDYNKKKENPQKAEELKEIPQEIIDIFSVIFGRPKRLVVVKDYSKGIDS